MKKLIIMFLVCFSFSLFAQEEAYEQPYPDSYEQQPFQENQPNLERSPDSEDPYPDSQPDPRLEEPQYQEPVEQPYEENY